MPDHIELARSTDEEKQSQLKRLQDFQKRNAKHTPAMLKRLQRAVIENNNVFEVLMDAVRVCSLGQITSALTVSKEYVVRSRPLSSLSVKRIASPTTRDFAGWAVFSTLRRTVVMFGADPCQDAKHSH